MCTGSQQHKLGQLPVGWSVDPELNTRGIAHAYAAPVSIDARNRFQAMAAL